ncbi:MAG TPA: nuclear transport factor 2 family protein [Candidatus Acidoferrum sp.]|nr:nuclear transport factor 2 family protein [Candidatus Acidoferrum sp.]
MKKQFASDHFFEMRFSGLRCVKKQFEMGHCVDVLRRTLTLLLAAGLLLANLSLAAQKDKKKKKDDADSSKTTMLNDEQQINLMLSEMMGAWQVGDVEKLHSTYADDVSIVSATWAPPVMGWANYLAIYQEQRARMQRVRMDRTNTFIKVKGDVAWACYQWSFTATLDGQPMASQGQATVVVEKRSGHWVIVHNHMSLTPPPTPTPTTPQQPPAKPNGF